ncbi:MAG TPA: tetratricopeptide repeat protein [Gammaproteobacteria bacterium]|nr:tetratricopeptide repeat protein [Gammaproteobacteria bacterium]
MKRLTLLLIVILAVTYGCQAVPGKNQPRQIDELDALRSLQEYDQALARARQLKHYFNTPTYKKLLQDVRSEADVYDQEQAGKVQAKILEQDWDGAYRLLRESLGKYSGGEKLQAAEREFINRNSADWRELYARMLIAKADWVLQTEKLQQSINNTQAQNISSGYKNHAPAERKTIAKQLYDFGKMAYDEGNLELANDLYTMSDKLDPSLDTGRAKAQLDQLRYQRIQREQQAQQKKAIQQRRQRVKKLSKTIEEYLRTGDLIAARNWLAKLRAADRHSKEYEALRKRLTEKLDARIHVMLNRGNALYSNNRYEESILVWKSALELDPKNSKIQANISRAERVLKRLNELEQRGGKSGIIKN